MFHLREGVQGETVGFPLKLKNFLIFSAENKQTI